MLLHPMSQTDVLIVDVFLCLPTFQLLCLLILPNYKTQRFFPEVLSNRLNTFYTIVITFDPSDHSYAVCVCVCVCFCVLVIYMKTMHLI